MLFEKRIQKEVERRMRAAADRRWLIERVEKVEERCDKLQREIIDLRMKAETGSVKNDRFGIATNSEP